MDECTITIKGDGDFAPVKMNKGLSLAEGLNKENSPIRYGCESGVCATCLIHVLEGMENLTPAGEEESETLADLAKASNARLACQFKVNGDITIEYIGFSG